LSLKFWDLASECGIALRWTVPESAKSRIEKNATSIDDIQSLQAAFEPLCSKYFAYKNEESRRTVDLGAKGLIDVFDNKSYTYTFLESVRPKLEEIYTYLQTVIDPQSYTESQTQSYIEQIAQLTCELSQAKECGETKAIEDLECRIAQTEAALSGLLGPE
jgi:hypothetical protein